MNFNISTISIQQAIKVLSVVAKANATDSSGRILIEATGDSIKLMANNGSTMMTYNAEHFEVIEPGTIAITYSDIKSFVASFKPWDGESGAKIFNFTADERNTIIVVENFYENGKSSKSRLKLTNYNPALVTRPPEFNEVSFTLNSKIFRAASSKVLYAIDPQMDFSMAALQGMNIKFDEDDICFVGSNGIVLSEYQVKNVSDLAEGDLILQYDFIMGLRRLISDDIQLLWEIKGNAVSVKFDDIVYTGRRIVGYEFPDYKTALDEYTDYINLSKEFLTSSLYPFNDILEAEDHYRITFEIKDKILRIFSVQATVEAEQDITGGIDFSVDLDGKYLIQTIEAIKDDFILIKFSDEDSPVVFDSSTFNDQKALILPLKKR